MDISYWPISRPLPSSTTTSLRWTREMLVDFAARFTALEDPRLATAALQFLRETVRNIPRDHPQMARIAQIVWSGKIIMSRYWPQRVKGTSSAGSLWAWSGTSLR